LALESIDVHNTCIIVSRLLTKKDKLYFYKTFKRHDRQAFPAGQKLHPSTGSVCAGGGIDGSDGV
jgi:hypothetical protein